MAMHSRLDVGSIITTYQSVSKVGKDNYNISFHVLYVKNRRERTSGVRLPKTMMGLLNKYSIRCDEDYYREQDYFLAIGCRQKCYYQSFSNTPYPTKNMLLKAEEALKSYIYNEDKKHASGEDICVHYNSFVEETNSTKLQNKDALFALQPTLTSIVEG